MFGKRIAQECQCHRSKWAMGWLLWLKKTKKSRCPDNKNRLKEHSRSDSSNIRLHAHLAPVSTSHLASWYCRIQESALCNTVDKLSPQQSARYLLSLWKLTTSVLPLKKTHWNLIPSVKGSGHRVSGRWAGSWGWDWCTQPSVCRVTAMKAMFEAATGPSSHSKSSSAWRENKCCLIQPVYCVLFSIAIQDMGTVGKCEQGLYRKEYC